MSLINLTPSQLRHAADLKEKIESLQHELSRLHVSTDGAASTTASTTAPAKRARRKISAAGIARIRAAQKARWAKVKAGAAKPAAAKPGKRGPRKMSAAARAKIAAAARARWARVRAAKAGK
jgi:hypothetical protein